MPRTSSGRNPDEDEQELQQFITLLQQRAVRRYLEIGARYGDTFYTVMRALPAGSYGVAVDVPGVLRGTNRRAALTQAAVQLGAGGRKAVVLFGNSHLDSMAERIRGLGPFDAVFIDSAPTLSDVARDWDLYGALAPLVAFHDIVGNAQYEKIHQKPVEVPILWQRIKNAGYSVRELIAPGSTRGIGIVEML